MNQKNIFPILFAVCTALVSCAEPATEDTGYEAPNPPSAIVEGNLITLEFFSRLDDETLFQTGDYNSIVSHITANIKPAAYLFDRSDATIGQTSPVVNIAWQAKLKSFFVQNGISDTYIQGTGMIVRPLIPVFEGISRADSLFLAGCTMTLPCSQPITAVISTCKITETYQPAMITQVVGDGLKTNKIVIGTIKSTMKDAFKDYLKHHLTDFRLAYQTSEDSGKTYTLFILTPVNFVSRNIQEMTVGGIPMYQCKVEYLNQ